MKTVLIALSLTGLAVIPAAHAEESFPFNFEYNRSSLQTEEGTHQVRKELHEQIKDACNLSDGRRGVAVMRLEKACIDKAMKETLAKMNPDTQVIASAASETGPNG
jgi:UrcA family protein